VDRTIAEPRRPAFPRAVESVDAAVRKVVADRNVSGVRGGLTAVRQNEFSSHCSAGSM
jgi:hypothetical protein